MKQRSKKLLGILLSLTLLLSLVPSLSLTAFAAPTCPNPGCRSTNIEPLGDTWECQDCGYIFESPSGGDEFDDHTYAQYKNTTTVIKFDDKDWYLIDYDDDTVTLLAKECVGASAFDPDYSSNTYSGSTVESFVNNWYSDNITADAKGAVNGSGMFLLTTDQANELSSDVRKCSWASGADQNFWWLCSPSTNNEDCAAMGVYGEDDAEVTECSVFWVFGVRPALKLDLSKVTFDYESKTFSLAVTNYDLWVGGVQVTEENAGDVLGDGKVSYDAENHTLTLNGATITESYKYAEDPDDYAAIYTAAEIDSLTINVTGDNTVTGRDGAYGSNGILVSGTLTFTGTGTLTATGGTATEYGQSVGVYAYNGVTVNEGVTLTATGGTVTEGSSFGVFSYGNVTVGGTLTATGDASGDAIGVYAPGASVIINGTLTATGDTYSILGTVKNAVAGTGWTNVEGTEGEAIIAISTEGQDLSAYKKICICTAAASAEDGPLVGTVIKVGDTLTLDGDYIECMPGVIDQVTDSFKLERMEYDDYFNAWGAVFEESFAFLVAGDKTPEPDGFYVSGGNGTQSHPYTLALHYASAEPAPSAYAGYVPAEADDATALAAKVVKFNGMDWYLIEDNSTSATEGTVTLFSKECVGASQFGDNNTYSGSTLESYVNSYYADNFSAAAQAAVSEGLFILTTEQAQTIHDTNVDVLKCSQADGAAYNKWWLSSSGSNKYYAAYVYGDDGVISPSGSLLTLFGVRPALKLDLSKVEFNSETKTFALPTAAPLDPVASVTPSGGAATNYTDFAEAVTAWNTAGAGATLKLLADVETNSSVTINAAANTSPLILDLNGYGIRYTGTGGSVIDLNEDRTLKLTDSAASARTHYITLDENGRGVNVADSGTESATCVKVTGGYLTGGTGKTGSSISGGGVYDLGSFTMEGGTIVGNTASQGGGVFVCILKTFTMTGGTITGNKASTNGGGVCVGGAGTFNLSGGTITGNSASTAGGGVYVNGGCTFNLSGGAIITGNLKGSEANNAELSNGRKITVTGALDSAASIGVTMATPGVFTEGGKAKDYAAKFTSDNTAYSVMVDGDELKLSQPAVSYQAASWDSENNQVTYTTESCDSYTVVTSSTTSFENGKWYVVSGDVTINSRIAVSGTAHLILVDGKTLTAKEGITVSDGNTLNIYAQSAGTGALVADASSVDNKAAGIGGYSVYNSGTGKYDTTYGKAGTVTIHGGMITATGKSNSAGIGGGTKAAGGTVTIYNGTVTGGKLRRRNRRWNGRCRRYGNDSWRYSHDNGRNKQFLSGCRYWRRKRQQPTRRFDRCRDPHRLQQQERDHRRCDPGHGELRGADGGHRLHARRRGGDGAVCGL